MSTLKLHIENLKNFTNFDLEISLEKGLYAITGTNGSGKSTVIALLSKPFQPSILGKIFHREKKKDSKIIYEYGDSQDECAVQGGNWVSNRTGPAMHLRGFFEGSIIHGSRFSDANYTALTNATNVQEEDLVIADKFVRENLSSILHGSDGKYYKLKRLRTKKIAFDKFKFRGVPYFIDFGDKLFSQFSMSTGECLLISLLHFLNNTVIRNRDKKSTKLILIDEVELALHPSALKRLVDLLREISEKYNLVVYFSTHSIELVRHISPDNIYYLQRGIFTDIEVVNPCYPAYATRSLYDHDGYDFLILVEDILAKYIVKRIIDDKKLYESKLIHVMPCAGWENTIKLHDDIVNSNLVGHGTVIMTILDGDIADEFDSKYKSKGLFTNIFIQFFPIYSIEKFIHKKIVKKPDPKFIKQIGDRFFRVKSLSVILEEYNMNFPNDNSGKKLFSLLKRRAIEQKMKENEFLTLLCEFIYEYEGFDKLAEKLKKTING